MYLNIFGGSTLLHVLAAHPRVIATFGIAATVAMLASNVSVRDHADASRYARVLDRTVAAHSAVPPGGISEALDATERLQRGEDAGAIDEAVKHALSACGGGCADLTPATVKNDPVLLRKAIFVAELDIIARERGVAASASGPR